MERAIWKFTLAVTDMQVIEMPKGAEILAVDAQDDQPHIWAIVDPASPMEPRGVRVIGTGHPLPEEPGEHIGTFQLSGGRFVGHAFLCSK